MGVGQPCSGALDSCSDQCDQKKSKRLLKKQRVIRSIIPALWPMKEEFDGIGSNSAVLRQYTSYAAARLSACDGRDIERIAEWVIDRLSMLPAHTEWELHLILRLLSTRLGTLLLVGPKCFTRRPPFITAFWDLPLPRIESILLHWLASRIPTFRKLGRGLKGLCHQAIFSLPGEPHDMLNTHTMPCTAFLSIYQASPRDAVLLDDSPPRRFSLVATVCDRSNPAVSFSAAQHDRHCHPVPLCSAAPHPSLLPALPQHSAHGSTLRAAGSSRPAHSTQHACSARTARRRRRAWPGGAAGAGL
eukprot:jgi/Ulvmu1/6723/UM030_0056.1